MTEQPQPKNKFQIGQTLWWILVIACCLWAALEIGKAHMLASAAFIAAAAVAMPPTRAWLSSLSGKRVPGWALACLPFVLILVAAGNSGPSGLPQSMTAERPAPPPATEDVTANVLRFQASYIGAAQACKDAFQAIVDESESAGANLQTMYGLASEAKAQCRASRAVIGRIKAPKGLDPDEWAAFSRATGTCDMAYLNAEQTADKLMRAIDSGMRPSLVAEYQTAARFAVGGRQACEREIAHAAEATIIAHRPVPNS